MFEASVVVGVSVVGAMVLVVILSTVSITSVAST